MRLLALFALLLSACTDTADSGDPPVAGELLAALTAEPVAAFVGQEVRFDASASVDSLGVSAAYSDSAIEEFRFDFGDDGFFIQDVFWIQHAYSSAGTYEATVTVTEGDQQATAGVQVVVRNPPPSVLSLDVGADGKAAIGEWVTLEGRGFREDDVPELRFEGVAAARVEFLNPFQFAVQVPTGAPSGFVGVEVQFPDDDVTWSDSVRVARYALATDAWRGRANIIEFGDHEQSWPLPQTLELDSAAVVAMSSDGSYALLGDARFQLATNPTIALVDMTADWGPAVTAQLPDVGVGPLHGIALARDVPRAVVTDLTGFTVLDLSDPANPQVVGDREDYQFSEMSPTAIALSPDGTRLAVLSTFNDRLRFYSITGAGIVYDADSVDVGPGTQGLAVHPTDSLLYVLGGGGIGAIPPDLDFGNTTVTVVDFQGNSAEDIHGGPIPIGQTPIPVDITVGPSGKAWITTLDQNFGILGQSFNDISADPTDLGAWQDLVQSITDLGFGAAVGVDGLEQGEALLDEGMFTDFGFQAGIDVRYDERVYVATVLAIGTTVEVLSDDSLLKLSLDIDYGVAVGNLVTGEVTTYPMFTAPVVSYDNFQLSYDLAPLVELLLPPYAFGDVAIQP